MTKPEFTTLSSRGQVVIPLDIRQELHLEEGMPLAVMAQDDTILLKKVEMPKMKSWNEAVAPFRKAAKDSKLTRKDVEMMIEEARRSSA